MKDWEGSWLMPRWREEFPPWGAASPCRGTSASRKDGQTRNTWSSAKTNAKSCPGDGSAPCSSTSWGRTAWLVALQEGPGQGVQDNGIQCCVSRRPWPERQGEYCSYSAHLCPVWGLPIVEIYLQTGKSPEKGHLAGLEQMKSKEKLVEYVCSAWRRVWGNLIAAFCYRKSSPEGGPKLFSEVRSKRQQSQQVAARQALIGHNRKKIQTESD